VELSVENKLILKACKLQPAETDISDIGHMIPLISNWDFFTDNAILNGVGPIIHKTFSLVPDRKLIPEVTSAKLEQTYFMSLHRNMVLYEHFRNAVKVFINEGISVMALKGIALAESVYKDIGLRQMTDIDLLLKEDEVERCWNLLRNMGYQYNDHKKTEFHKSLTEKKHLPSLSHKGISIELHYKTFLNSRGHKIDIREYWDRAQQTQLAGVSLKKLCPEQQVQHTCMHLDEHYSVGKPQLHSFVDISEVISQNKDEFNWDYFVRSCADFNCTRVVFKYLWLASKYFDLKLPTSIFYKAEELNDRNSERLFLHYLQNYHKNPPVDITNQGYEHLKHVSGAGNKFKYLLSDIFPSKKFMRRRYRIKNKNSVYLYYIPRLGTGIKRMTIQLAKQISLMGKRRNK
jgi:hypothetical protein